MGIRGGMLMTSDDQTRAGDGGRSGTAGTDAGTGQAVMAAWQALGPLMDLVTPMALRVAATLRLADFMPDDGTGEGAVLGDLDANPAISASFDAIMAVDDGNAAVAGGYDWTTVRHVADIGGGTGTLIAEVLRRNPRLRGTLVDLPETAARARQYLAGLGLDDRCEVVGQSFFDPLPAGADAYLLSRVIHDWDDAAASAILRRCAQAAGSTGRVLVIESAAAGGDPAGFAEMNLRMLVLAGGRERTIDDYSALAAGAGMEVTAVHDTTERHVIIECVPV